jgi:predicted nucleic acid-binding protein
VLPAEAEDVFSRAERGTAVAEAPAVVFGEVFYRLEGGTDVSGVNLDLTPAGSWRSLHVTGPVNVASLDAASMPELLELVAEHSLHDAMLIASHRARGMKAIITRDPDIGDVRNVATLWD